jgi:hypothetical protein
MKECPCIECILIPICRKKHFLDIVKECKLIEDYLYHEIDLDRVTFGDESTVRDRICMIKGIINYEIKHTQPIAISSKRLYIPYTIYINC